ncbi:putative nuclease HARBI1 [Polypterus senegalus]|uniref:putative nuclease HARBI1 n=1 Tax=Polypterus senegalus TaxID=55291 RepID=UPI0019649D06|nr:putative nuclease HARBI1 [Polypterus senegalus]
MSKENATEIIGLLQPKLTGDLVRGTPISPSLQILITLRFLACGTYHRETGDLCGVGESTVCKIVHKVCSAICELKKDFIKFPNAAEQATCKVDFYEYGNFPGVIGCIDGCHIPIKCPSTADAEEFRNRKNWFSINVQGVCTPTMQFSNIVACWKGSTHDSRIFHNSSLYTQFEARQHSGILLGDSGYAQTNFLFTPYPHPVRPEQQRYNLAHILTRGLIERMFGVWKNRFQCLRNTLQFEPRRCCIVIIATAVLHNFLKRCGCPDPDIEDDDDQHVPIPELANDRNGLAYRDAFALQHFS